MAIRSLLAAAGMAFAIAAAAQPQPVRIGAFLAVTGPAAFLSHLEFVDALRRAVSRANLPIRFSQGFHPLQRITFGPGMPVGKSMLNQEFKIELESPVEPSEILSRLNQELPEGVVISSVVAVTIPRSTSPDQPIPVPSPSP